MSTATNLKTHHRNPPREVKRRMQGKVHATMRIGAVAVLAAGLMGCQAILEEITAAPQSSTSAGQIAQGEATNATLTLAEIRSVSDGDQSEQDVIQRLG